MNAEFAWFTYLIGLFSGGLLGAVVTYLASIAKSEADKPGC